MRYYHYISTSKVDMLFPQLPPDFLAGIKVELGFDFGLFKGKLAGDRRDDTADVARASAIERYLEKTGALRTEIAEGTWLRGQFKARSGFLPECPGMVLFGGRIGDVVLLLAGSEDHLVSGQCSQGTSRGWSFFPRSLGALRRVVETHLPFSELTSTGDSYDGSVAESFVFGGVGEISGAMFRAFRSLPEESLPGPPLQQSFVARIFMVRSNHRGEALAFGSPLFIAE